MKQFVKCDCQSCGGVLRKISEEHYQCTYCKMLYLLDSDTGALTLNYYNNSFNNSFNSVGSLKDFRTASDDYPEHVDCNIMYRTNFGCLMAFLTCIFAGFLLWLVSKVSS
jgi:hypothetical protein